MSGLTEQEENTLSDLHSVLADEQWYRDHWLKDGTAFELFRVIEEAVDLVNNLKERL